jgi:protein arginine kinase activator
MLCDICAKNPATVHLTEIIDNQMNELHLCEECAHKKSQQMESQFGLSDLLAGMADFSKPAKEAEDLRLKCPGCGLTFADFKKIGRLGCAQCYDTFKKYLLPLLKRIHGANQHVGKAPGRVPKAAAAAKKRPEARQAAGPQELRERLARAVAAEEFEEAARLRDQIKELEKGKSG